MKQIFGAYQEKRIFDFDELNEILDSFKNTSVKEVEPIGYTTFHYPIRHFQYGHGKKHVIITAGTHAVELITNHFLIHFMQELVKNPNLIDENLYTIHLIPILNPEGTLILTSAIRTVIPRTISPFFEELTCIQYYMNSRLEDQYVLDKNDRDTKLQLWMFRYADIDCIDDIHHDLKEQVRMILKEQQLPLGVFASWSSNGMGIDLNANVEYARYMREVREHKITYHALHLNQIADTLPGPIGCPTRKPNQFCYEPENKALLDFYKTLKKEECLIGSLIYHACGNLVYYLDSEEMKNPYDDNYGEKEYQYNRAVARRYAQVTGYQEKKNKRFTTFDSLLKTILPGTLLVELGNIRATPLSQFVDSIDSVYTNIMKTNTEAIPKAIEEMSKQMINYLKKDKE